MAKLVDKKAQQRVTLDTMLESLAQNGVIYTANLKKKWKSLKGIINPNRLIHFLKTTGTKLSQKSVTFLYTVRKDLSAKLVQHPDLILN
jgi:hypothetical protein